MKPWEKYRKDSKDSNVRFNAPYIKTMNGKPMVFSAEQERNMYFNHLRTQL